MPPFSCPEDGPGRTQESSQLHDVTALNTAGLMEVFDGDRDAVTSLLDAALASIRSDVARLRTELESGDRAKIVEIAHRLKGTSGTIGAAVLIDLADRIQTTAATTAPLPAPTLRIELEAAAAAIAAAIARFPHSA